ncbi:uncharacterized protein LOC106661854 isoform X1 [Cimex lectularius]|uniref:Uncharacterized protein n=1 Tax=Cimex lectularius TaxID=79782 RepID=A0A8I6SU97_CIMLE|nr:uncharacterized protein LOC106661854 isoform X1 [Cimex lectularius]XP_024083696.1 uncharacterized protein LOC106661854 isoform X1 [Cimex lectularius]XP_024083697.1 uncharacterized protein LOC106661854 isoform X1 [Cimex lectularius]XP_024083698.1 uncharacterized protein LOC106661854 isoform X1 [Cimex lectularius]XP_024083699.1 uncharacterized protein LOC106661854 isoform X1 [Cimex lectularius]
MMHAVGLHSALAIKRQRKRRNEQKRAKERRYSSQSTESGLGESRSSCASPRNSTGSLEKRKSRRGYRKPKVAEDKVVSSVGMLHIGVVFLVLGLFLLGSGLIPDDLDNWSKDYRWFNELFVSGLGAIILGLFFIILNKIIAKKEEDDLAEYVQRQLTRSKSGHRLVRDVETGCLTTKGESRSREEHLLEADINGITPVHFSPTLKSPPPLSVSTPRSDLERILEEEISEKGEEDTFERFSRENAVNMSYSPSPEKRELITARYYDNLEFYEK